MNSPTPCTTISNPLIHHSSFTPALANPSPQSPAPTDAAEPVQDAAIIPAETVTDSVLDLLKSVDPDLFSIF